MSEQSYSWYIRGEGNQPLGPLTEIQVRESLRVGKFSETTLCWREGMSKWLALVQVEPFASAIPSADVPRHAPAGLARSPAPRAGAPLSPPTGSQPATPRHAPPAWLGWAIGGAVAATCAVIGVAFLLLSAGTTGHNWGSSYSVDYTIASPDGFDARFKTTVKGPAAKLAVILTDPKGESDTQIIEKESMISNSQTVELPMRNPREGTYVLTVKTVEPEKVVWQKNIPLSLGQLTVADVKFDLTPNLGQYEGCCLEGVNVVLNKDGNLPVKFADLSLAVDGNECRSKSIRSGVVMVDRQHTVGVQVNVSATAEMEKRDRARGGLPHLSALFRPGERHSVKGKLFYGEDRKSLEFEKEFVTPQDNKKPGDAGASVPPTSPAATTSVAGPTTHPSDPVKPTPPGKHIPTTPKMPGGLQEGINRLSQRLREHNELEGNFDDYKMKVPKYRGDETEFEIGFLHPNSRFYAFRTVDGGQTWSPGSPTNPYLIRIAELARRKAEGGSPGAHRPTRPKAEPPRKLRGDDEEPKAKGPLSGTWQAAAGARFRIMDDGQSLRISLVQSGPIRKFTGELTRTEDKSDSFAGTLEAVFRPDVSSKQYSIRVTATLDDSGHLRLRCADWPTWNNHGKYLGTRALTETWTRQ